MPYENYSPVLAYGVLLRVTDNINYMQLPFRIIQTKNPKCLSNSCCKWCPLHKPSLCTSDRINEMFKQIFTVNVYNTHIAIPLPAM